MSDELDKFWTYERRTWFKFDLWVADSIDLRPMSDELGQCWAYECQAWSILSLWLSACRGTDLNITYQCTDRFHTLFSVDWTIQDASKIGGCHRVEALVSVAPYCIALRIELCDRVPCALQRACSWLIGTCSTNVFVGHRCIGCSLHCCSVLHSCPAQT